MADCFEGSIFETKPAGLNLPIIVPPSSLSLSVLPTCATFDALFLILDGYFAHTRLGTRFLVGWCFIPLGSFTTRWFTDALSKAPPQDQTVAFQTSGVQFGTAAIKATTLTEICIF